MIFTERHGEMNVRGEKTQTRRVQKVGDYAEYDSKSNIIIAVWHASGRCKYQVGKTYANQPGRGKKGIGRNLLLAIREEALWAITDEDIKAEGCKDLVEFGRVWNSIYKKPRERWTGMPTVWVLTYEFVAGSEAA